MLCRWNFYVALRIAPLGGMQGEAELHVPLVGGIPRIFSDPTKSIAALAKDGPNYSRLKAEVRISTTKAQLGLCL